MWQQKRRKGKKKERKKETIKIHIGIKGQHKLQGESSSIREARETGILEAT